MAVIQPNDQDNPSYIAMAVRDRTDGHADRQPALGTGVLSGVVVTGTGASVSGFSGAINVSAGSVAVAGTIYSVASVAASVTAPSAGDRRDVVIYRVGTGVTIIPGPVPSGLVGAWTVSSYPTLPPVKPTIGSVASVNVVTSTDVLLAEIYVPYNASVITSGYTNGGNIVDKSYVMTGLDVVASILQPSANVENIISSNAAVSGALQTTGGVMTGPIAMGTHKITGVGNGSSAQDVAAFGQIPTALPPNGSAGGDLTGTFPNPTVVKVNDTSLAALGTGLLKNTTGTGIPSIAVPGTDYITGTTPATPTVTTGSPNTVTVSATTRVSNIQNSTAGALQVTISTTGALDGALVLVRIYDFSGVPESVAWVNTENSAVVAPPLTNGSTTLPMTALFQFNAGGTAGGTNKWRCLATA